MKSQFEVPEPSPDEETAKLFVQVWAESVLRQAERTRAVRKKSNTDSRAFDRNEDWSPALTELEENWRRQWAEEHLLVWNAHQLERWRIRLAEARGQNPLPVMDADLKNARDALEHLYEVVLTSDTAVAPPPRSQKDSRGRALRDHFPEETLRLELGGVKLFELLDPETLDAAAMRIVNKAQDELDARAEDAAVQELMDSEGFDDEDF